MKKPVLLAILSFTIIILSGCLEGNSSANLQETSNAKLNLPSELQTQQPQQMQGSSSTKLVGIYRCWSYNVQGAGKSCTSPPIVLKEDGTYSMSSEQGTFTINEDVITLSESKIRGSGKILENGFQIRFEYEYNGWKHTVTYLKVENNEQKVETVLQQEENKESESVKYVEVTLNIVFLDSTQANGINTITLISKEGKQVGEALAYESKPGTLTALFRKYSTKIGIPTGKTYDVYASSGFGKWQVGEINLTNVEKDIELEIRATTKSESSENKTFADQPQVVVQNVEENTTSTANLQICDPNVPKYSQPPCRDG